MLEMMMLGGKKKVPIPTETGPGGNELLFSYSRNATQTAGYFGRVTAAELITGAALATLGGITSGTAIADAANKGWLKFLCDGKILFVAQACFKNDIRPGQIGAAMSSKQVTINGFVYKLRLISGTLTDNDPNKVVVGTEWNRLIYSVSASSLIGSCEVADETKWDNLTSTEMGFNSNIASQTICQETSYYTSNPNNYRIVRGTSYGNVSAVGQLYNNTNETRSGWRPVLELVGRA